MDKATAPKRRLTRAERKQQTHLALLDAARRTFVDSGYQGSSLDAVAAEAGFTKGAVYAHFASKEELLCAVFEEALLRDIARLEAMVGQPSDKTMIVEQMGNYVDFVDERDELPALAVELQIEAGNNPNVAERVGGILMAHQQSVARVIDGFFAIMGGRPPLPAEQLAPTILNLIIGFALAKKAGQSTETGSAPIIRAMLGLPVDAPRAAIDPFAG